MKTLITIIIIVLFTTYAHAGQLDSYKASNGKLYKIGDAIKLGRGSAVNGDFLYLQMGGMFNTLAAMNGDYKSVGSGIGKTYSGVNVVIKKIKEQNFKGAEKIIFVVAGGNITNYNLMIEDAIATCEIVDCKEKVQKVEVINQTSKYDELKKLKELLDSKAITEDEYKVEKEKLLK